MKKLQNNFTTPEQSKRLLELGVPADSADMKYWEGHSITEDDIPLLLVPSIPYSKSNMEFNCLPCWSVGRLIEIHTICGGASSSYYISAFPTNILNEVMWHLTEAVRHGWIDFSKLED